MSPRKPTIDGLDDIDDEDGALEEEVEEENDLTLHAQDPEDAGLNQRPPEAGDPYVNDEGGDDER